MNQPTQEQYAEVCSRFFRAYPFLRKDNILKSINSGNCLVDGGTAILVKRYKRNVPFKSLTVPKGSTMVQNVVMEPTEQSLAVLKGFVDSCEESVFVCLKDSFTELVEVFSKLGFAKVGVCDWKKGTILGGIYQYNKPVVVNS